MTMKQVTATITASHELRRVARCCATPKTEPPWRSVSLMLLLGAGRRLIVSCSLIVLIASATVQEGLAAFTRLDFLIWEGCRGVTHYACAVLDLQRCCNM